MNLVRNNKLPHHPAETNVGSCNKVKLAGFPAKEL